MAGIVEGVNAGELPAGANTLPATAPLFHGLADSATAASAKLWAERSPAAGTTGVALKFVRGLWLVNPGTSLADAALAASATGGALGTTGALASALHVWDTGASTYRPVRSANGTADGIAGASNQLTAPYLFDESLWNRHRGNTTATVLASAARTANTSTAVLANYNHRGAHFDIGVTAKAAATTLTPRILDATGGSVVATGPAFAATAGQTYSMQFYPGVLTADFGTTGSGKSIALPRSFVLQIVHSDANSVTYSVVCYFIV